MIDQIDLHRPCCRIAESTDCVPFDLLGQFPHHVNLARNSFALHPTPHDFVQPVAPLPARRALTAALMFVKLGKARNAFDDIALKISNSFLQRKLCKVWIYLFVHNNDCGSAKSGIHLNKRIEIHQNVIANALKCLFKNIFVHKKWVSPLVFLTFWGVKAQKSLPGWSPTDCPIRRSLHRRGDQSARAAERTSLLPPLSDHWHGRKCKKAKAKSKINLKSHN